MKHPCRLTCTECGATAKTKAAYVHATSGADDYWDIDAPRKWVGGDSKCDHDEPIIDIGEAMKSDDLSAAREEAFTRLMQQADGLVDKAHSTDFCNPGETRDVVCALSCLLRNLAGHVSDLRAMAEVPEGERT